MSRIIFIAINPQGKLERFGMNEELSHVEQFLENYESLGYRRIMEVDRIADPDNPYDERTVKVTGWGRELPCERLFQKSPLIPAPFPLSEEDFNKVVENDLKRGKRGATKRNLMFKAIYTVEKGDTMMDEKFRVGDKISSQVLTLADLSPDGSTQFDWEDGSYLRFNEVDWKKLEWQIII